MVSPSMRLGWSLLLTFQRSGVLAFATRFPFHRRSWRTTSTAAIKSSMSAEDPYLFLEDVEGEKAMEYVKDANARCLEALGDPTASETGTYDRVLQSLESDDRIPYARKYGVDDDGNTIVYNFWKDAKVKKKTTKAVTTPKNQG